jgi:hypothetical protein
VEDTTLLSPIIIRATPDGLVTLDWSNGNIRGIDELGRIKRTVGSVGDGPGELRNPTDLAVATDGSIVVLEKRKVMTLESQGALVFETSHLHLPSSPTGVAVMGDRLLLSTQSPIYGFLVVDRESLSVMNTFPYSWVDTPDNDHNLNTVLAVRDSTDTWVGAFTLGPGFFVHQDGNLNAHRYIDRVPFAYKSGPIQREMGADSARWGARSVSIVGDEIFFLFGGRPHRSSHEPEATRLIDVYGLDGLYRRSYLLPFHADHMATRDGRTFHLLTLRDNLHPAIVVIRPH